MSEALCFVVLGNCEDRLFGAVKKMRDIVLLGICGVGYLGADANQTAEYVLVADDLCIILHVRRARHYFGNDLDVFSSLVACPVHTVLHKRVDEGDNVDSPALKEQILHCKIYRRVRFKVEIVAFQH